MRDELEEQKELNKKLFNTLISLQDKYEEVCKELREYRERNKNEG